MTEKKQYHVCHKCGLPRQWDEDAVYLGACKCLSQTWFEFEETLRTMSEAVEIGVSRFLDYVKLYVRQGRNVSEFKQLVEKYKHVINHNKGEKP